MKMFEGDRILAKPSLLEFFENTFRAPLFKALEKAHGFLLVLFSLPDESREGEAALLGKGASQNFFHSVLPHFFPRAHERLGARPELEVIRWRGTRFCRAGLNIALTISS